MESVIDAVGEINIAQAGRYDETFLETLGYGKLTLCRPRDAFSSSVNDTTDGLQRRHIL